MAPLTSLNPQCDAPYPNTDGELIYEIPASSLDDATGAQIPEEPSYLIINTAGKSVCLDGSADDRID